MTMIVANSAQGKALAVFTPLAKFNWITEDKEGIPTVMAVYKPGLTYTIREGNDILAAKAKAWAKEGKIKLTEI